MKTLEDIQEFYVDCKKCNISKTRTNIVFGRGGSRAAVLFVGEAPGKNEDLKGFPFVGAAGNILSFYIQEINLTEENYYITNIVKCRPPQNRNPYVHEISNCSIILSDELEIISPKVIVPLGLVATKYFLNINANMGDLRGRMFIKNNYKIIPMYHPAALLRDKDKKVLMLQDFKKLKQEWR